MIFSPDPHISDADVKRLLPKLKNVQKSFRLWLASEPPMTDLKKALIIEVEMTRIQYKPLDVLAKRGVVKLLLKRISEIETMKLETRIQKLCSSK